MSDAERRRARQWFAKADADLTSARLLAGVSGPPETRCFLAQQGAEKYLKGYLAWHGVPFRKVHDLLEILNACRSVDDGFRALEADCRALNPYSVQVRYPGYLLDCVEEDAIDALTRAGLMHDFVRGRLGLEG